jgi:UDP-N-acetylmuramate--alanine ligase
MKQSRLLPILDRMRPFSDGNAPFLFVDSPRQRLYLCKGSEILGEYAVSTSRFGFGSREGSNKTPTGFHRIADKIGAGAPERRIFRERRDTGVDWRPGLTEDNLILTRILRLEGLEPGINKGDNVDSYERYIYLHGTNREDAIGAPLSHGCVCMRPGDIVRLFDEVAIGTIVFIDAPSLDINGIRCAHLHFTGVFGSGMSALAQYLRWQGVTVSGSDRFGESPDTEALRSGLDDAGCLLFKQDGSGVTASTDCLCVSTAIEETNPDIAAARAHGIPVVHRSDVLAAIMATKRSIAVAGTSGKSTVTAMIFEFLTSCEKAPSLLSGAALRRLEAEGIVGNAFSGTSDLLVVEADESDGTIVKYRPAASVILNISKDHKGIDETEKMFASLAAQSAWTATNADDRGLDRIAASARFSARSSTSGPATWRPDHAEFGAADSALRRGGVEFRLPLPGEHNAENLAAALCVCEYFGCDPHALAAAVAGYQGVARRFSITATNGKITVVDDFAHNPAKIAAAVSAARGIAPRILAVYQPHGFGPTRFLKNDYIETFKKIFSSGDSLFLLPIYYAGGTAVKDISSDDIVKGLGALQFRAATPNNRDELLSLLSKSAKPGDCVLVMGARDPSLPGLVRKIVEMFGGKKKKVVRSQ